MPKQNILEVQGTEVHILSHNNDDYISLTDMTSNFEGGSSLIEAWLRNKSTVEFLGIWEKINNSNFNSPEFEGIKNQSGSNIFTLSAKKWVEKTNGIGLIAKAGRYGGTFAHKDIAFEFGSWLSPEFKLYLITEFQRLKQIESSTQSLEWNIKRTLTKVQYRTHTDAVKAHLIPSNIPKNKEKFIYADEADVLNVALFGRTAKEWKEANKDKKGCERDYATIEQLVLLSSLESQHALLIEQGIPQKERLTILNKLAIQQMKSLLENPSMKKLSTKPLLE